MANKTNIDSVNGFIDGIIVAQNFGIARMKTYRDTSEAVSLYVLYVDGFL